MQALETKTVTFGANQENRDADRVISLFTGELLHKIEHVCA